MRSVSFGASLGLSAVAASVSSDSQDPVGESHGFLSLRTILREGSAKVSLWNMSSSSLGPSSAMVHAMLVSCDSLSANFATCCDKKDPHLCLSVYFLRKIHHA